MRVAGKSTELREGDGAALPWAASKVLNPFETTEANDTLRSVEGTKAWISCG